MFVKLLLVAINYSVVNIYIFTPTVNKPLTVSSFYSRSKCITCVLNIHSRETLQTYVNYFY